MMFSVDGNNSDSVKKFVARACLTGNATSCEIKSSARCMANEMAEPRVRVMKANDSCPCTSGLAYSACCGQWHAGVSRADCRSPDAISLRRFRPKQRTVLARQLASEHAPAFGVVRSRPKMARPQDRQCRCSWCKYGRNRIRRPLSHRRRFSSAAARAQPLCSRGRTLVLCRRKLLMICCRRRAALSLAAVTRAPAPPRSYAKTLAICRFSHMIWECISLTSSSTNGCGRDERTSLAKRPWLRST